MYAILEKKISIGSGIEEKTERKECIDVGCDIYSFFRFFICVEKEIPEPNVGTAQKGGNMDTWSVRGRI